MRCKNCKEKFEPIRFNHKYCLKDECIKAFVDEVKTKSWQTRKKAMQNNIKTKSDLMKEAQSIFNTYIRLRDANKPCVSCGGALGEKYDAGHYFSMGGHKSVTFDERNVHAQCVRCNRYLHGNLLNYQIGIEQRIGAFELMNLHEISHQEKKYSVDELLDIIRVYKEKVKKEKKK